MTYKRLWEENLYSPEDWDFILSSPDSTAHTKLPRCSCANCSQQTAATKAEPVRESPTTPSNEQLTPMNANTACGRVFGIPELADHILLQMHPVHILCSAMRVCRQWQFAINKSPRVQELLFMKGIDQPPVAFSVGATGPFPFSRLNLPVENPFNFLVAGPKLLSTSPDASWRRMIITQPPHLNMPIQRSVINKYHIPDHPAWAYTMFPGFGVWEPFRDWDQLNSRKKRWRRDEHFLELELAEYDAGYARF